MYPEYPIFEIRPASNKIPTQLLFPLDSLKERLEITSPKSFKVVSLDDLNKHGGAVHEMLEIPALAVAATGHGQLGSLHLPW